MRSRVELISHQQTALLNRQGATRHPTNLVLALMHSSMSFFVPRLCRCTQEAAGCSNEEKKEANIHVKAASTRCICFYHVGGRVNAMVGLGGGCRGIFV